LPKTSITPKPIGRALAYLCHVVDNSLPGRLRGRLARLLRYRQRRFLAPEVGKTTNLIERLNKLEVDYAVIGSKPSLTIIVSDDHVGALRRLVSPWPIGQAVEIYSPSGLPGFEFSGMPLMPPRLANGILQRAVLEGTTRTASAADGFYAELFRLVYLQSAGAGIPSVDSPSWKDDATVRTISENARQVGLALEETMTLESLDSFMSRNGWRPPLDMLERIGCWNPWVANMLRNAGEWVGSEAPGLTVFYLRKRAIDQGLAPLVFDVLQREGFELPTVPMLSEVELAEVAAEVRGGNWGRGPFPLSGGVPGLVFVGYDPSPIAPDRKHLAEFPLLDNNRIQIAKQAVREAVHADLPRSRRYNAMHSTDNSVQAWRAVRQHFSDHETSLRERTRK
jgi:hypothetical protein